MTDSSPHSSAIAPTNAPDMSVSELSQSLKRAIEDQFGYVRVRGEVSGYRGPHSSGHCYFALKDQSARIDAIIWKGVFSRLRIRPEEGMEVVATGKVTTYPGRSSYQIVIESIEPAGVGALLAQLEERRQRLAKEGLFDAVRKRPLPYLPRTIGVVTSPTGSVIRDILHRIADRFPVRVLVWPVRVQGETCGPEVAAAIRGFNALRADGSPPPPDVIIVARGGGSLEDLWGFNHEDLVRAAAGSEIPLISAVGHETDWTLIDHAADVRAPTPTAAAELAVPVRSELLAQVTDRARRHVGAQARLLERARADFRALARILASPEDILAIPRQRVDASADRLRARLAAVTHDRHRALARAGAALMGHSPRAELGRRRERITGLGQRLHAALGACLRAERQRLLAERRQVAGLVGRLRPAVRRNIEERKSVLTARGQLLQSLGYRNVLTRGFALVRDRTGAPLRAAAQASSGMALDIEFADGHVGAVVDGDGGRRDRPAEAIRATRPARSGSGRGGDSGQGTLF